MAACSKPVMDVIKPRLGVNLEDSQEGTVESHKGFCLAVHGPVQLCEKIQIKLVLNRLIIVEIRSHGIDKLYIVIGMLLVTLCSLALSCLTRT